MKALLSLLFLILIVLFEGAPSRADVPSVHGMVLFGGSENTYVSHLPMFHAPHDRQLILKVSLKDSPGSQTVDAYVAAKEAGKTLFTIEPQVMDLEKIVNGSKTEFVAAVYVGHFERGGQNLGKLKVLIEKIVFSTKLNGQLTAQNEAKYFLFGKTGQYFAAHIIQGKPSFDAILEVSQPYTLSLPHCRTRLCAEPTKSTIPDQLLPLTLSGASNPDLLGSEGGLSLGDLLDGNADVKSVIYLEQGDLSH